MPTDRSVVLSLEGFAKNKREGCTVCALPLTIRTQLEQASSQRIRFDDRLHWLVAGGYPEVTRRDLLRHRSGGH